MILPENVYQIVEWVREFNQKLYLSNNDTNNLEGETISPNYLLQFLKF